MTIITIIDKILKTYKIKPLKVILFKLFHILITDP